MLRQGPIGDVVVRYEGRCQSFLELINLARIVAQPVVIRDIVEELLCVQGPAKKEGKVPIRSLDDLCYYPHRCSSVKGIFVGDAVFDKFGQHDELLEGLGDT